MTNLESFITLTKSSPAPFPTTRSGKIIDGVALREWTIEELASEAFNQNIISSDEMTYSDAVNLIIGISEKELP